MIKFHWMQRVTPYTLLLPDEMKDNNQIFNKLNYESVLLTYYEGMSNAFIKIANSIKPNDSFKYMVAVRPFTVSIDFLISILNAFNEISKDRIVLNLVVGNVSNEILDYNKRLEHHREFIKDFRSKYNITTYISGSSDYVIETGLDYADGIITEFANYNKFKTMLDKNIIFLIPICVRDTKEEAESLGKQMGFEGVYGNINDIKIKLEEIENMGIKQLMLCPLDNDDQQYRIHDTIYNLIK